MPNSRTANNPESQKNNTIKESPRYTSLKDTTASLKQTASGERDHGGRFTACDPCHHRKTKCDNQDPCSRCQRLGLICEVKRQRKERTSYNTKRSDVTLTDKLVHSSLLGLKRIANVTTGKYEQKILTDFDIQVLILPPAAFSEQFLLFSPRNKSIQQAHSQEQDFADLLDFKMDLIDSFYEHFFPILPVMPESIFMSTIHNLPLIYVVAVHALGTVGLSNSETLSKKANENLGMRYLHFGRKLIDHYIDHPTPLVVHGIFLLGVYALNYSDYPVSWTLVGMALRMALDLGLHEDSRAPVPEIEDLDFRIQIEIKRRIWWLLYIMDTFICSASNVPSWIHLESMTVPLPVPFEFWTPGLVQVKESEEQQEALILSSKEPYVGGINIRDYTGAFVLIIKIHGQICHYARDLLKMKKETVRPAFSTLEASVNAFCESIPEWARHNETMSYGNVPLFSKNPLHWVYAHLTVSCYVVKIFLYKTELLHAKFPLKDREIEALNKIKEASRDVVKMVQLFLESNPVFLHLGFYASSCIFDSAIAWILLYKFHPSDVEFQNECIDSVELMLKALGNMGDVFFVAKEQHSVLVQLISLYFTNAHGLKV